jgi:hypothetical protein
VSDGTENEPIEAVLIKPFGGDGMMLLPPDEGLCQQCARDHDPAMPHDQQSLHWQYWFRLTEVRAGREERWPTWDDAMAHCTPQMQDAWRTELRRLGVDV